MDEVNWQSEKELRERANEVRTPHNLLAWFTARFPLSTEVDLREFAEVAHISDADFRRFCGILGVAD